VTRRTVIAVIVALVVVVAVVIGTWAFLATRPCTPTGEERSEGSCPPTPLDLPTSTTFIAAGTVFSITGGQYVDFQFLLEPASWAEMTGSFTTNNSAAVSIMDPSSFAEFSGPNATKFSCSPANFECFTTGVVQSGNVNISMLPAYRSPSNVSAVEPWFLVMQNGDNSTPTGLTWVVGLSAIYTYIITASPGPIQHAADVSDLGLGHGVPAWLNRPR
jgi:hypothetical protein